MEHQIIVRPESAAVLRDAGDSSVPAVAGLDSPIETLIGWVFEFIDDTLDESVVKNLFDGGYVTDEYAHQVADEEDIYITLWTILVRNVCEKAVDKLNLYSFYDETETRERVHEFLCANEEEIETVLVYKARKILSDENIMYATRESGIPIYVNPTQTFVMKGV